MRCSMTVGHVMQLVLALVSYNVDGNVNGTMYLLAKDDQEEGQHDFWVMYCHWQHCILEVKTFEMKCNMISWSFDATGTGISVKWYQQHHQWHQCRLDNWNEVQQDFFSPVMPLIPKTGLIWFHWHWCLCQVMLLHCVSIINGTTAFVRLRWSKWSATWPSGHLMLLALASESIMPTAWSMAPLHSLAKYNCREMPCDAIAIGVRITCHRQHHQWHHCISLGKDDQNELQHDLSVMWHNLHWHQCHIILVVSSMAPLHSLGQDD